MAKLGAGDDGACPDHMAPEPGLYGFGPAGKTAQWDGAAWTGTVVSEPANDGLPAWHRSFLPFARHRWFWVLLGGVILTAVAGAAWAPSSQRTAAAISAVPGVALIMVGALELVGRHMRFNEVSHIRELAIIGLAWGIVATGLSVAIEAGVNHLAAAATPWVPGIVEETLKLLLPVVLLAYGGSRFRDPRAGLFLALCAGAGFGLTEAIIYIYGSRNLEIFLAAVQRPLGETFHPYLTGFAAAVIWLAAWRRKRTLTRAGIVAWLIAVALHTLNDGPLLAFMPKSFADEAGPATWGAAVIPAVLGFLLSGVLLGILIWYFVCRVTARELVPPDAVATNVPGWRPRIRRWGCAANAAGIEDATESLEGSGTAPEASS